jgi:hypothetical protein
MPRSAPDVDEGLEGKRPDDSAPALQQYRSFTPAIACTC